ncbi:hypothetical protein [Acetivibrio sp. MSJd-27]|uniref:hypothetical protein n=1 Tax=Acetivibrio sp. MSJd-27 TaxID=2841523 RepID=UPI001C125112|nr:hypothetical protein [Acetivibrio sp. MSJd-27]MBU5451197.1 hypothetical protein [Acetivibrio sp. MSJd-27]
MGTNKKMFSDGGTYISKIAIARLTIKKHIQIIIGGFFTAVFLFGIISGVTGYNENLRDNLITNVVMIVPSALLLLNGIKNGRMAARAYRYNSIFMCDVDGTVTINELAKQSGKPPFKVLSELEKLFEKGVFCECTLQKQGSPCVILSGREGSKTGFVNIVCEKCNGTTRIRAGSSGKCEYCGNAISSRNSG